MCSGVVVGVEALIRWQHPDKGLLPPAAFLPLVENHPLAVEIGEWVINTALLQIERWQAFGLDIPISVNVGARQLQQNDFVERLRETLAAHPTVNPINLEMEVLETSALKDLIRVSQVIKDCRELGVMFALDDFGTGYSSLTYLKRLPVSILKIDQSFVRDMLDDPDDLTILEGVISLANAFHREVIAEGVETVEHGEMLLQLGCELAQGYGIARPMPAADFPAWASTWKPDAAWSQLQPVSREHLPLLFAGVEHRAWVTSLELHCQDELNMALPPDFHRCRFGLWLGTEGQVRYGTQTAFRDLERLHRQFHESVLGLCDLREREGTAFARASLGELHEQRDVFLAQLKLLVRESRQ
jgi:EAL domain-containing protein (putative c-di-GMP-specific phosphodiesterase class I)